jgi:hypothetical protein
MKKHIKKIAVLLIFVLIGIQFVPTKLNQSAEVSESDLLVLYNAPQNVQNLFKTSCYDCHSNNTHYPWYSKIQPGALFMESHINDGKKELNFNEFGDYSDRRKKGKLKSMISQIKEDEMPIFSYTLIHQDAKLSEKEKQTLTDWLTTLRDSLYNN